ncbi:unnamed protein product [Taenia asiatica]|uniref:Secreted protein n=1 Tax=Taenia asiatica TaxID=60517 RepID=A0A0R3VV49_TAEAS|nr:unnamed protein product [Taenia asiatica]
MMVIFFSVSAFAPFPTIISLHTQKNYHKSLPTLPQCCMPRCVPISFLPFIVRIIIIIIIVIIIEDEERKMS